MSIAKLLAFTREMTTLLESTPDEPRILSEGSALLSTLVAEDDWLPDAYAQPHPRYYQQYLLYADPLERLSVVSFVWGSGQKTPVHDHLTWGLIGVLRGREREITYRKQADGSYLEFGRNTLSCGQTGAVSPTIGDVHEVANDLPDQASISIHVYGANIGRVKRHVFEPSSGASKEFISGYANTAVPNLWS